MGIIIHAGDKSADEIISGYIDIGKVNIGDDRTGIGAEQAGKGIAGRPIHIETGNRVAKAVEAAIEHS